MAIKGFKCEKKVPKRSDPEKKDFFFKFELLKPQMKGILKYHLQRLLLNRIKTLKRFTNFLKGYFNNFIKR